MYKRYMFASLVIAVGLPVMASRVQGKQERQIPVVVSVAVKPKILKNQEAIPLAITVSNGLSSPIFHSTFSMIPNDWNGETCNVSLVDIYRDDKMSNLYIARPKMDVPSTVSGMGRREIKPGKKIEIQTDARKWKIKDGWLPGRYRVTVCVDNLRVGKYYKLSVWTDPIEFEIR